MTLPLAAFQQPPHPSPALHDDDLSFADGSDTKLDGKKRKLPAEKRATHNKIERARRESLNGRFQELADALPASESKKDKRASKSVIVNRALQFVYTAQVKEYALIKENNELRIQANELRAQLGMSPLPAPAPLPTAPLPVVASPAENSSTPPSSQPTNSFVSTKNDEVESPFTAGDHSDDGAMPSPPASVVDRKPTLSSAQIIPPKVYSIATATAAAPIIDATTSMLPAPIPFTQFPPTPSYFPSYDSYGANLQLQQQQLMRQHLEQQAQYQYGFAPSIISQQHAAMVSAHLQQAHHQRVYQDFLLAAAAQSTSTLGSDGPFSMHSLSPQSSPNSSVNLENSPRSFCSNEMSLLGAEAAHSGEFSFAGMKGVMMGEEEEAFGYC